MFDKMRASFGLARSAWLVLLSDKQLIVFPLISGFACLIVFLSFLAPVLASERLRDLFTAEQSPLVWVYLFAFYFVSYFVIIFFNSALVACALIRFNGDVPTLGDGLSAATARLPQIIGWALVAATVGVLLKAIENVHEKIGALVASLLGTAWSVITFFVVPVLVVEKTGPVDSVKRSIAILKNTWGEALIGNFGLGLFTFLLLLPGIAIALFAGWLMTANQVPLAIGVGCVAAIYFIIWGAVSSALNGIFVGALYQYAVRGQVPDSFDRNQIEHAFAPKPA